MWRSALLFLLGIGLGHTLFAKGCNAEYALSIDRAEGTSEYYFENPQWVYFLAEGDSATLMGWNGSPCVYPYQYLLLKDGLSLDLPPNSIQVDVSSPGYYELDGTGFDNIFPIAFFIARQEATTPVLLNVKAWLQGAFISDAALMRDDLRTLGLYTGWGLYPATDPAVMTVTGPDAVVDMVNVELRLANSPQTVCGSRYGLLQRDGDIVSGDGYSSLSFDAPTGNYYVVVSHRNHLRAMTATAVSLGGDPVTLDFRDPAFPTYGNDARKIEGNAALLWAGKANWWPEISYTGPHNDRDAILQTVGPDATHTVSSYSNADVNMDGIVKYTGADNDRDIILLNLGSDLATGVREEQVP